MQDTIFSQKDASDLYFWKITDSSCIYTLVLLRQGSFIVWFLQGDHLLTLHQIEHLLQKQAVFVLLALACFYESPNIFWRAGTYFRKYGARLLTCIGIALDIFHDH